MHAYIKSYNVEMTDQTIGISVVSVNCLRESSKSVIVRCTLLHKYNLYTVLCIINYLHGR